MLDARLDAGLAATATSPLLVQLQRMENLREFCYTQTMATNHDAIPLGSAQTLERVVTWGVSLEYRLHKALPKLQAICIGIPNPERKTEDERRPGVGVLCGDGRRKTNTAIILAMLPGMTENQFYVQTLDESVEAMVAGQGLRREAVGVIQSWGFIADTSLRTPRELFMEMVADGSFWCVERVPWDKCVARVGHLGIAQVAEG